MAVIKTIYLTLCYWVKMATVVFVETLEGLQQMRLKPGSRSYILWVRKCKELKEAITVFMSVRCG
jgi:hypothetical protein